MTTSERQRGSRFGRAVRGLTAANFVNILTSAITSPLMARTVGPGGRGEIAAAFAFVSVAPIISELGLTSYITRERARGEIPKGRLVGTIVPVAVGTAVLIACFGVPIAHLLGRNRPEVVKLIEIGVYTLPLYVFFGCSSAILGAEGRWSLVSRVQAATYLGTTATLVILAVFGDLTVMTAALTYIVFGLLCDIPLLAALRGARPLEMSREVLRTGIPFGLRSWLSTIAAVGNLQLDQILMAAMVSSKQLGWYALAATIGNLAGVAVNPIASVVLPRVATGQQDLMALSSRLGVAISLSFAVPAAVTAPWTVPLIFGQPFTPAVPMLAILVGASVVGAPCNIIGTSLVASGHPGKTARAQVVCLCVNVGGLLFVLPRWGALGAAWINLIANCVLLAMVVPPAVKTFQVPWQRLLIVSRADLVLVRDQIRAHRPRPEIDAA